MSAFLSGAAVECGPSNVLKNVNGRLDRDMSLHQNQRPDGRQAHHSQVLQPHPGLRASPSPSPFDLSQFREHLASSPSAPPVAYQARPPQPPNNQQWAATFRPPSAALGHAQAQGRDAYAWAEQFDHAARSSSPLARPGPGPSSLGAQGGQQWHRGIEPGQMSSPMYRPAFGPGHMPMPMAMAMQPAMPYAPAFQVRPPRFPSGDGSAGADGVELGRADKGMGMGAGLAYNAELAGALDEIAREMARQHEGSGQTGMPQEEQAARPVEKLVDRNGREWAGDFTGESSNQREDAAAASNWEDFGQEAVAMDDDTPADLARVLGIPPPIPTLLPLRPGGESVFAPHPEYTDQEAILMSESARGGAKSVHFSSSSSAEQRHELDSGVRAMGNGVPQTLDDALAHTTFLPGASARWEEKGLMEDEADFNEEAFMQFNGAPRVARDGRIGVGALEGWADMERDWADLQRGVQEEGKGRMRGMGVDERYLFQSRNPYAAELEETGVREIQEGRGSPTVKGVLELEAAVQADPSNHHAWYALGLKQQENERESAAILALSKVVQLDPSYRPAYLALGVSYTNEGEMEAATTMLERWIDLGLGGAAVAGAEVDAEGVERVWSEDASATEERRGETGSGMGWKSGQKRLVDRLIELARTRPGPEEVDADVQVALGVLFNASEEWEKAEDCFMAALGSRPDDWLLYNRLGATLANGGRSSEAVAYYNRALELHPNFVRALFNLGISYINLAQYDLAAQRVLDALRLQQADATEGYAAGTLGNAAKGVTSEVLWNTLRNACLHMGRSDLVALASSKDLSGFPGDVTGGRVGA